MANVYTIEGGQIRLQHFTPVIKALYCSFDLRERMEHGLIEFYRGSNGSDPNWGDLSCSLMHLLNHIGLSDEHKAALEVDNAGICIADVQALLSTLANHFQKTHDHELMEVIENIDEDETIDLVALYRLAQAFDDGHGLQCCMSEHAVTSDRQRLFYFSGGSLYLGKSFSASSCANSSRNCAKEIDEAITSGNDDLAADLLARQMITMLSGVRDEKRRQALTALAISKALAPQDVSQVLA